MKYDIHGLGRPWISIICGDDSVTVTLLSEIERIGGLERIVAMYADFGMEVEAKVTDDPLLAEFCSGRFYPSNGSFVLMPKPGRMLSKICWDMKARNPENRQAWLRGIANTLATYGQVDPLINALSMMLMRRLGVGKVIVDATWEHKSVVRGEASATEIDVAIYYDAHYGLNECDIRELTHLIANSRIGEFVRDSRLRAMAEHDL